MLPQSIQFKKRNETCSDTLFSAFLWMASYSPFTEIENLFSDRLVHFILNVWSGCSLRSSSFLQVQFSGWEESQKGSSPCYALVAEGVVGKVLSGVHCGHPGFQYDLRSTPIFPHSQHQGAVDPFPDFLFKTFCFVLNLIRIIWNQNIFWRTLV